MLDARGRDQFLVQHQQQQLVCWNDTKKRQAEPFFSRAAWSEGPMCWSPLGTYAATLHPQGVALWTSKANGQFERAMRFPCPNVQRVDFSKGEEVLTCYSVQQQRNAPPDVLMTVFDCRSGRKLRTLQESLPRLLIGRMQINSARIVEPFLAWSPAAPALAAKLAQDCVQVYSGADMTLLDKKSLTLEGVQDACWSPSSNTLAVYQEEHGNLPARVAIIALPERTELRQKNLFAVASAKLYWHPQASYLAVHVRPPRHSLPLRLACVRRAVSERRRVPAGGQAHQEQEEHVCHDRALLAQDALQHHERRARAAEQERQGAARGLGAKGRPLRSHPHGADGPRQRLLLFHARQEHQGERAPHRHHHGPVRPPAYTPPVDTLCALCSCLHYAPATGAR